MINLRTTQRWGLVVLILGSLVFASTEAESAPIKFNITDLGNVSGYGLDNDGNVIDSQIRNIVGKLPSSYPTQPGDLRMKGEYNEVIDGTADGRLLFVQYHRDNIPHAFVYNPNATRPWEGPEIEIGDHGSPSFATDMNAQGAIVGRAVWGGVDGSRPFYAAADSIGRLQDLNDLIPAGSGWKLTEAWSINDRGQILASGVNASENRGGMLLLTPVDQVPEPATWAVFGLAAAAFAYRRRRAG